MRNEWTFPHRPWCSASARDHQIADPVFDGCITVVSIVPGVDVVATQMPHQSAPIISIEADFRPLTLVDVYRLRVELGRLLNRLGAAR
jgi:hypothetical protein